jgi:hypothetical protein
MLRSIKPNFMSVLLLIAAAFAATASTASQSLKDLRNFAFEVTVGTFAFDNANFLTLVIEESDDNAAWADAPAEAYYAGDVTVINSAALDNMTHVLQYKGSKPYVRLKVQVTGVVSVPLAVNGVSTELEFQPQV